MPTFMTALRKSAAPALVLCAALSFSGAAFAVETPVPGIAPPGVADDAGRVSLAQIVTLPLRVLLYPMRRVLEAGDAGNARNSAPPHYRREPPYPHETHH